MLRTIIGWGWSPALITGFAIAGFIYEWPLTMIAPVLATILVVGLAVAGVRARERQQELLSSRLRQLAGYFNRRFTGNSALSIFAVIGGLFAEDNPQLWEWARACAVSQRIFDTWCNSFVDRIEADTRTGRFNIYLRTYLNELWLLNNHYYEFVEQFREIAERMEVPEATKEQYQRFSTEYNSFVQTFRDGIMELKKAARTQIEPPTVREARELALPKPLPARQELSKKPETTRGGYYS